MKSIDGSGEEGDDVLDPDFFVSMPLAWFGLTLARHGPTHGDSILPI
jgi:hypothetical protein